jgi:hypothetical protein
MSCIGTVYRVAELRPSSIFGTEYFPDIVAIQGQGPRRLSVAPGMIEYVATRGFLFDYVRPPECISGWTRTQKENKTKPAKEVKRRRQGILKKP